MPNPSYYQTSPPVSSQVQHQEHLFHMYAHQQANTNGGNELTVLPSKHPNHFGCTNVVDWDIRDGPDTTKAKVVARLQGLGMAAGKSSENWYNACNMLFTDQRFKGSTLSMQGPLGPATVPGEGDWTVVGGTGEFTYAQGVVNYKRIRAWNTGTITELHIRIVCLIFPKPNPVQKVGPWGGKGGAAYEIQEAELPQRLQSVTIYANDFIETIAFSYIDQTGQNRTVGPWGGDNGKTEYPTIKLGSSETVKEIFGATGNYSGHTVVTSLTIVTNVTTYGPYGKHSMGNKPFHEAAPDNHSIVGFYGRVGDVVDQIGAYVRPN